MKIPEDIDFLSRSRHEVCVQRELKHEKLLLLSHHRCTPLPHYFPRKYII